MFEPRTRTISRDEISSEINLPIDSFLEDQDHFILVKPGSILSLFVPKKAYVVSFLDKLPQHRTINNKFFNILQMKYRLPYIPGNDDTNIMLGKYFLSEKGPSFLITEPKDATHALFTGDTPSPFYYTEKSRTATVYSYEDEEYQVYPIESVFEWIGRFTYLAKPQLIWEQNRFMKSCQVQFYGNLEQFYAQA